MAAETDWHSLIFQSGWLQKLDKLAAKRFGEGGLAEEASTYVIEKISSNNWHRLSSFSGQCKAESYLHTVASNFLEEFSRKRFGRPRPPEWLQRQGALWIQVWKMLCLERQLVHSVIEQLSFKNHLETSFINDVIIKIKARLPWCGDSNREVQALTTELDEYDPAELIVDDQTPETAMSQVLYTETLMLISGLIDDKPIPQLFGSCEMNSATDYINSNQNKLIQLRQKIKLTDQEKIILKMIFQDGVKKSLVAKSLGLQEHIPGRIIKKVLARIANIFQEVGINLDEIHEIGLEITN